MTRLMILAVALSFGAAVGQVICMQILDVTLHQAVERSFWQITGIFTFALVVGLVGQP